MYTYIYVYISMYMYIYKHTSVHSPHVHIATASPVDAIGRVCLETAWIRKICHMFLISQN
jgi:hypothetical protein